MYRFLVVEDHALVRESMVGLLRQMEEGVSVQECADLENAFDVLDEDSDYDLMLLDLALPGVDGFSGLDILRRRYPAMPVVVVSAFDDPPSVTRAIHLGASGFIPKALNGSELLHAVRHVLEGNIYRPSLPEVARLDKLTPPPPATGRGVRPEEIGLTERQAQVLDAVGGRFQISVACGVVDVQAHDSEPDLSRNGDQEIVGDPSAQIGSAIEKTI